jgi:hypothetical protein
MIMAIGVIAALGPLYFPWEYFRLSLSTPPVDFLFARACALSAMRRWDPLIQNIVPERTLRTEVFG